MFLFLLLFVRSMAANSDITIRRFGLAEVWPGEMAMRFFIEVLENGPISEHIIVTEPHCCEIITEDIVDCHSIHVEAGDMGAPAIQIPFNVTLLYLNLYSYNRRGICVFNVYTPDRYKQQVEISYDTTVLRSHDERRSLYGFERVSPCASFDEDPYIACQPVRCDIKYGGARNYFNSKTRICEPTPICQVAWDPLNNECINPEISHDDIAALIEGKITLESKFDENMLCINGYLIAGTCACFAGWGTRKVDLGSAEVFRLCATSCRHDNLSNEYFADLLVFWSIRFVTAILFFLPILIIILLCEYFRKRSHENVNECQKMK